MGTTVLPAVDNQTPYASPDLRVRHRDKVTKVVTSRHIQAPDLWFRFDYSSEPHDIVGPVNRQSRWWIRVGEEPAGRSGIRSYRREGDETESTAQLSMRPKTRSLTRPVTTPFELHTEVTTPQCLPKGTHFFWSLSWRQVAHA